MAVKKVIIPKSELPEIDVTNFTYNVRYRVISDDKNRISHWSRIHNINASSQIPVAPYNYHYVVEQLKNSSGALIKSVRFTWIVPVAYQYSSYDIYLKDDSVGNNGLYNYYGTSYTNSYTIMPPVSATQIEVIVQAPTYPKVKTDASQLFSTVVIPLVI